MITVPGLYSYQNSSWDFDFFVDYSGMEEAFLHYTVIKMRICGNNDFPLSDIVNKDSDFYVHSRLLVPYPRGFLKSEYPEYCI